MLSILKPRDWMSKLRPNRAGVVERLHCSATHGDGDEHGLGYGGARMTQNGRFQAAAKCTSQSNQTHHRQIEEGHLHPCGGDPRDESRRVTGTVASNTYIAMLVERRWLSSRKTSTCSTTRSSRSCEHARSHFSASSELQDAALDDEGASCSQRAASPMPRLYLEAHSHDL